MRSRPKKKRRRVKQVAPDTVKFWEGRVMTLTKFNRAITEEEFKRLAAGADPTEIPGCTFHMEDGEVRYERKPEVT